MIARLPIKIDVFLIFCFALLLFTSCGTGVDARLRNDSPCTLSGTWQTVDDYQHSSGRGALGNRIMEDSHGNLFVAGLVTDDTGGGR